MSKFIFVSGGVASSVGKGITVASLGRLLKNRGISVSLMKLDPYINVDPGTMSPYQHGEVFVTVTMNDLLMNQPTRSIMLPQDRCMPQSLSKNAEENIWVEPSR